MDRLRHEFLCGHSRADCRFSAFGAVLERGGTLQLPFRACAAHHCGELSGLSCRVVSQCLYHEQNEGFERGKAFSREGFADGAVVAATMTEDLKGVHEFKELLLNK